MPTRLPTKRFPIAASLAVLTRAKLARYLRQVAFESYNLQWTAGSYVSRKLMKVAAWVTGITRRKTG
jgi:hypothetical protein